MVGRDYCRHIFHKDFTLVSIVGISPRSLEQPLHMDPSDSKVVVGYRSGSPFDQAILRPNEAKLNGAVREKVTEAVNKRLFTGRQEYEEVKKQREFIIIQNKKLKDIEKEIKCIEESWLLAIFNFKRAEYDAKKIEWAEAKLETFMKRQGDDIKNIENFKPEEFDLLEFLTRHYIPYLRLKDENGAEANKISLPILDKKRNKIVKVAYTINRINLFLGQSIFGFTPIDGSLPDNARPFLLAPGTKTSPADFASGPSTLNAFDPSGVGFIAYCFGESKIEKWLKTATDDGLRPAVGFGFSQGGAIAVHCAVYLNKYFSRTYAVNSPGTGFLTARRWRQVCNNSKEQDLNKKIINIDHHMDMISVLGQEKIGSCFHVQMEDEELEAKKGYLYCHKRGFDTSHKISSNPNPKTRYPYMQILPTFCIFILGSVLLLIKRLIFGCYDWAYTQYLLGPIEGLFELLLELRKLLRPTLEQAVV